MPKFKLDDLVTDQFSVAKIIDVNGDGTYTIKVVEALRKDAGLGVGLVLIQEWSRLDSICELYQSNPAIPAAPTASQVETPKNFVTLQDAIKFELQNKKPKHTGLALTWFNEGRCPHCGELGRYHLSTAICSKHGVY